MKHNMTKLWDITKEMLRGKFMPANVSIKKEEKFKPINKLLTRKRKLNVNENSSPDLYHLLNFGLNYTDDQNKCKFSVL